MKLTLKYSGQEVGPVNVAAGLTVAQLLANANFAAVLGYDRNNVEAYVNGAAFSGTLREGDVVTLQQKAHKKA